MYYAIIENGYIIAITTNCGQTPITKELYDSILVMFRNKPTAESGYDYMLRADTLEWELVELPPSEDEPSAEEPADAWDVEQGEYIPAGRIITVHGVMYECIKDHYAAWSKQPPHAEYWKEV